MPKFLDYISWYDQNGVERTIKSEQDVGYSHGTIRLAATSSSSKVYLFGDQGRGGAVGYWHINGYPMWTAAGETGQFLKSNGSSTPTWSYVGFSYYAMRVNYDGNHNNLYNVYDINGNLITGSGRTGIIVIAGKASNDQGSEEVMVNRLAKFGTAASSMYELILLDIFIAAPQFV